MVVRPVKALCDESGSVRSTQEYLAQSRQQERPDRSQETSRAAAQWIAFGGLPRREWRTNIERTGAQLSDHQQGSRAPCAGTSVYAPRHRSEWLSKITEAGVRRRAEHFYQQLDALQALRQEARRDLLAESRKHGATKLLCQVPCIGPIRAALLIALIQTPHRFRTKRQLWAYSGLALETRRSAEYRFVAGELQRSKKLLAIRGLNRNHNHDLKDVFKSTAILASRASGAF